MKTLTVTPPDPWWTGENRPGDEALNEALLALKRGDVLKCLEFTRTAMRHYGWEYHSDQKARRLWKRGAELARFAERDPVRFVEDERAPNGRDLYHEVVRAVHLDTDRRVRRNMPPLLRSERSCLPPSTLAD